MAAPMVKVQYGGICFTAILTRMILKIQQKGLLVIGPALLLVGT